VGYTAVLAHLTVKELAMVVALMIELKNGPVNGIAKFAAVVLISTNLILVVNAVSLRVVS
jgi:hypothetical protein